MRSKRTLVGPSLVLIASLSLVLPGCDESASGPAPLEVTAIDPATGAPGTTVTLTGAGFATVPSDNIVTFNGGVIATVETAAETELTVSVPEGAVAGPVRVEVAGEVVVGPSFEVLTDGSLRVIARSAGVDPDTSGFRLTLSTGQIRVLAASDTVRLDDLEAGSYDMELADIAVNCRLDGNRTRSADVIAGEIATVAFDLTCHPIGKLAFVRGDYGTDSNIWVMNGDGTRAVRVAGFSAAQVEPVWWPDGSRVGYTIGPDGSEDIHAALVEGSSSTIVAADPASDVSPHWSPDSELVAYSSDRSGDHEIWVAGATGLGPVNLTGDPARDREPRWSPDGTLLAFVSDRSGTDEIWVVPADGSANPVQVTDTGATTPRWSPDGTEILFRSGGGIWKVNADGTGQMEMADLPGNDIHPAWSPDGSEIVFRGGPVGERDIYVMNADGTNLTNLTNDATLQSYPVWSPDGSRIAFSQGRDIWVMWADGTGRVNLLETLNESETEPAWRPAPGS